MEKACTDPTIINENNLEWINHVDLSRLSGRDFVLYK